MGCCESNNPKANAKQDLNNNLENNVQSFNINQVQQNGINQKIVSNGNYTFTQFKTTQNAQTYEINKFDDDDMDNMFSFMENAFKNNGNNGNQFSQNNGFFATSNYIKIGGTPNIIQIKQNKNNKKEKNLENLIKLDQNYAYTEFQKKSLERHNYYRRMHHVCDLQLSNELCEIAQKYADYLATNNEFEHSHDKFKGESMGENLYKCTGYEGTDGNVAVDSWYEEIEDYNFKTGKSKNGNMIGHFTQLVWKESKYLGVGVANNQGTYTVVANYFPAGNYIGKYTENVFPE